MFINAAFLSYLLAPLLTICIFSLYPDDPKSNFRRMPHTTMVSWYQNDRNHVRIMIQVVFGCAITLNIPQFCIFKMAAIKIRAFNFLVIIYI